MAIGARSCAPASAPTSHSWRAWITSRGCTSTRSTRSAPAHWPPEPTRCAGSPIATTQASPRPAPPTRRCANPTPTRCWCCAREPSSSSPRACGRAATCASSRTCSAPAPKRCSPIIRRTEPVDLTFTDDQLAFRDELRDWLAANAPGDAPADEDANYRWRTDWQRRLNDGGWAGVHWPKEYGGRGASLMETAIFFEEMG